MNLRVLSNLRWKLICVNIHYWQNGSDIINLPSEMIAYCHSLVMVCYATDTTSAVELHIIHHFGRGLSQLQLSSNQAAHSLERTNTLFTVMQCKNEVACGMCSHIMCTSSKRNYQINRMKWRHWCSQNRKIILCSEWVVRKIQSAKLAGRSRSSQKRNGT